MSALAGIKVLVVMVLALVVPVVLVWTLFKLFQGLYWLLSNLARAIGFLVGHVYRFVRNTIADTLSFVGAVVTAALILPLTLVNILFLRFSAVGHYGRALEDELIDAGLALYRVGIGNPIRLLGLGVLTDGVERRLPELVARAPRSGRKAKKGHGFEGYKVLDTLPAGGSGARLFLARPRAEKLAALRAAGHADPGRVVIKSFALDAGSTLPQIVRESRALEAANRLGLVLEHELSDTSFHYVMPYVPGDDLDVVIRSMHAKAGPEGLGQRDLRLVMSYASDLLFTLDRFHTGGLWHKDVKPSNLIVSKERVHLVDLGLVTPLQSAMTLTTHGTEYYRDPEMVRLALKGVKVHEVDGVKFDVYSAGAVLFSMVENSFPAHGSLSRISKRCPEALRWIVRRAMADMSTRYGSAHEMLADLRTLAAARDPFALKPAELPSVNGDEVDWGALRGAAVAGSPTPDAARAPRPLAPVSDTSAAVRRRTSRGLLAAGLWAGLLFVSVRALAELVHDERGGRPARIATSWPRLSGARVSARDPVSVQVPGRRGSGAGSRSESVSDARAGADGRQDRPDSVRELWARHLDGSVAPDAGNGTVLLLGNGRTTTDARIVAGLREELEGRGCEVLGAGGGDPEDEHETALVGGALLAVGLCDPTDGDAVARLEDYLQDEPALDAIVWLSPADDDDSLYYRLIVRRDVDPEAPATFALAGQAAERH